MLRISTPQTKNDHRAKARSTNRSRRDMPVTVRVTDPQSEVVRLRLVLSLEQFTEEALDFLNAHANLRPAEKTAWGEGSDSVGLFSEKTKAQEQQEVADAKAWRQSTFDGGFGWITGPAAYGGRELP